VEEEESNTTVTGDEEPDYLALLEPEPDAKEAPKAADDKPADKEEPAATVDGDVKDAVDTVAGDDKPAEETPASEEKPAPGTPDKVVQKLQQDLAAATRQMAELQEKVAAGKPLTEPEKAKADKVQRKLDTVRAALSAKGKDIDLLDPGVSEAVAESLLEADKSIEEVRKENAALKARLEKVEAATTETTSAATWQTLRAAYPAVAVQDVWNKAVDDAIDLTGITPDAAADDAKLNAALNKAASKIFHSRAAAAQKSAAAKSAPEPAKTEKKTARSAPPVTPNGARVSKPPGVTTTGEVDEDEQELALARSLVID